MTEISLGPIVLALSLVMLPIGFAAAGLIGALAFRVYASAYRILYDIAERKIIR